MVGWSSDQEHDGQLAEGIVWEETSEEVVVPEDKLPSDLDLGLASDRASGIVSFYLFLLLFVWMVE